jgi:enoyl-CoA hydratase/carnithine racemase
VESSWGGRPDALVLAELDDAGVLLLTLNRPERRNQWTADMETAYFDALERAGADPAVRAVVVTGSGRAFCPGLDPEVLVATSTGATYSRNRRRQTFTTGVPKPVIAAVNGACGGIGLVQALYCDLRFAARGAKFSTAFARRGLPAEDGAAWVLGRLVGHGRAMELLLSGRVFRAEEAHGIGMVQQLSEPEDVLADALGYARDLCANCSPVSLAMIKDQVWHDPDGSLEQARVRSQQLIAVAKAQPDFAEGAAALAERRATQFPPWPGLHL